FVGELLEVRARDCDWRGAIERVLHGFALSLLVDEEHYAALSGYVNATNLGTRLVYHRCGSQPAHTRHSAPDSLMSKLDIKEDCEHRHWLHTELALRFDYTCVDSLQ